MAVRAMHVTVCDLLAGRGAHFQHLYAKAQRLAC
jgi:hypothetical protein